MRNPKTSAKRKYTTITIPTMLFDKLQGKIRGTGFSSVSDYATYILRETVAEMNSRPGKGRDGAVFQKLKALGYME